MCDANTHTHTRTHTYLYSSLSSAWACNHMLRFLLSILCMWCSLHNCTVIFTNSTLLSKKLHIRIYTAVPTRTGRVENCAQKRRPDCISPTFVQFPVFVAQMDAPAFDLKILRPNHPHGSSHGAFSRLTGLPLQCRPSRKCVTRPNCSDLRRITPDRCFASRRARAGVRLRGVGRRAVWRFCFSHALPVLPGYSSFLCLLLEEWGSAG